jgi:hypothetical protein
VTTLVWSTGTSTAIFSTSSISVSYVTDIVGLTGETLALGSVSGSSTVTNTWTFVNNNIILPPGGDILDSNGVSVLGATTSTIALPSWITVVAGTNHLPTLNTDYGWDSSGAWTVNATILENEEGTSFPFRTTFSIPNDTKSVTTVDFVVNEIDESDFGIAVFASGTTPEWVWGELSVNTISAKYTPTELYGISDSASTNWTPPSLGTYRARLTVEPTGPGTADIMLETLDTSNNILDTLTYTETEFFGTDYKIGFASDNDGGVNKTYFKNLTIDINDGATVYTDTLMNGSSTGGTTTALGDRLTAGSSSVVLGTDGVLTLPDGGMIAEGMGAIRLEPANASSSTQALLIYPTVVDGNHIHLTAGGGETDLYLGNDDQFVKIDHGGDIVVQTYSTATTSTWTFGTDGELEFPQGSTISETNTTTIIQAGINRDFLLKTEDYVNSTIRTWTFGTDGVLTLSTASTILGNSSDPNVYIETASTSTAINTWTFAADGGLTLPEDGTIKGYYRASIGTELLVPLNALGDDVLYSPGNLPNPINSSTNLIAAGWNIVDKDGLTAVVTDMYYAEDIPPNNRVVYSGTLGSNPYPITFTSPDYVADVTSNITIVATTTGSNTSTWTFAADGSLTFPDATVQRTAYLTGQQTVLVNAASTGTAIELTELTGTVIWVDAEPGYSVPSETHYLVLPYQDNPVNPNIPLGTRITVINNYSGTVAVRGWPGGPFSEYQMANGESIDLVYHYTFNYGGNLWWITNTFNW